jgi:hypothetical protein
MPEPFDVALAVRSKCAALIADTKDRVAQIDVSLFPTPASESARLAVERLLDRLSDPQATAAADPEVLYNRLIKLQVLVDEIENSSSRQIPWPLVHYCNDIWGALFRRGANEHLAIFYSLTHEYNYVITSFSGAMRRLLVHILAKKDIDEVLGDSPMYCLHLPSIEQNNLPLYANIAHEYGHVLYDHHREALTERLDASFSGVLKDGFRRLNDLDPSHAARRRRRFVLLFTSLAQEVFADAVAATLAGPAYFLSLYEMAWGVDPRTWSMALSPIDREIRAYPSPAFRLNLLKQSSVFSEFDSAARVGFRELRNARLRSIMSTISGIGTPDDEDVVDVFPNGDIDAAALSRVFKEILPETKAATKQFAKESSAFISESMAYDSELKADRVGRLLQRFEDDILPNIVPDGTLLGQPADFPEVLNAAALYRMWNLVEQSELQSISQQLRKIERLTLKALEVSYVQRQFHHWERDPR